MQAEKSGQKNNFRLPQRKTRHFGLVASPIEETLFECLVLGKRCLVKVQFSCCLRLSASSLRSAFRRLLQLPDIELAHLEDGFP